MGELILVTRGERLEFDPGTPEGDSGAMTFLVRHLKTAILRDEAIVIQLLERCPGCGEESGIGARIPQLPLNKLDRAESMARELLDQGVAIMAVFPQISLLLSMPQLSQMAAELAMMGSRPGMDFWARYTN